MHAVFIPYGKKEWVDLFIREMQAQKHLLKMQKEKEEKNIWVQGSVRLLPFGVYEYIFPREDIDVVLNTLDFNSKGHGSAPQILLKIIKKALKLELIPEFKKEKKYLWIRDHVSIIPLGVRYDDEVIGIHEEDKGWRHEGL